jgi:predicted nuclease of restriction endonuclease-like (RecB) superfamily
MAEKRESEVGVVQNLFADIARLITESKASVAQTVNTALTILYWKIGKRINQEVLQHKRADYGMQVIVSLAEKLTQNYGKGWSEKQLRHCLRSAETFSEDQILYASRRQLSWTHLRTVMYLNDGLQREFYLLMAANENWTTKQLGEKINSMLYERTAISKKPEDLIQSELKGLREDNTLTPDLVFRDPYILDFLGLQDAYSEKSLEEAILRELEKFILELGQSFSFIARQKRMLIDGEDFKLDLLFYHRRLHRMVAIDLKLGKFKAAYKSQMELYLRWLEKHEMVQGEEPPIGLILCAEGNKEQIELLQLHKAGIKVAEYLTELPDKNLLQQKLHTLIQTERKRLDNLENNDLSR